MATPPAPVRIRRTELNLSFPDSQPENQRLSRRFEKALRHSLTRIPDRLLPQTDEPVHLGTLNLDLGNFDFDPGNLSHWHRLEGLFQERLRQQLLALLKQASSVARPNEQSDGRGLSRQSRQSSVITGPVTTSATGTGENIDLLPEGAGLSVGSPENPTISGSSSSSNLSPSHRQRLAAVAAVTTPLKRLLALLPVSGSQPGQAGVSTTRSAPLASRRALASLSAELHRSGQSPSLPEALRRVLAELVSDLEQWLAPTPATEQLIPQLAQLLRPLQQAARFSRANHLVTDEQQILAVLDKPFRASEDQANQVEVSCIALEAALGALIVRRQLAPALAAKLGLWLSRQATLSAPLRIRRLQALHRYLRQRPEASSPLTDLPAFAGQSEINDVPASGLSSSFTPEDDLPALHKQQRQSRLLPEATDLSSEDDDGQTRSDTNRARTPKKTATPLATIAPSLSGNFEERRDKVEIMDGQPSDTPPVNSSLLIAGEQTSGGQEDHSPVTGTTSSRRSLPDLPDASGANSASVPHKGTRVDRGVSSTSATTDHGDKDSDRKKAAVTPLPLDSGRDKTLSGEMPSLPSATRIAWMVESLLADPTLPCHLARDLSLWQQRFERLPPLSRYRWLEALHQRLQHRPAVKKPDSDHELHHPVATSNDRDYHRLYRQFVTSWASAPVHSLAMEWTTTVQQFGAALVQAEHRLALSEAVQRLFVVISVAAERHTDMAGWLRRYRKRWRQWLGQLDPVAQKLSFINREHLWTDRQPVLSGWPTGALIVELDRQLDRQRRQLDHCKRSRKPLAILLQGCLAVNIDQPVDLPTACRSWLELQPPGPASLKQAMEELLARPEPLTPDTIRNIVKEAEQALNTETGQRTDQLKRLRQLTADVFCSPPGSDLEVRFRSVSLPEPPGEAVQDDEVTPLPDTFREQGEKLLKALRQALRPAVHHHPMENDLLVSGAGLVLFWPHLRRLFAPLLNDRQQWLSPEHQWLALAQLMTLGGLTETEDGLNPVAALLTGFPVDTPVTGLPALNEQQRNDCTTLLTTVVQQWQALKGMSGQSLQQLFIQRTGYLDQTANGWRLTTEHKPQDILLQALPWPVSVVRLPWMDSLLAVEWDSGPGGLWRPFQ
ncbi:contractile injection system tape measure protein [Endozoicomonas lisbonensis]|uniref:Uncharacterized protein n=1 Tax=Endozoicomonas lisbonensis TaxID=3120522 RepID=A0ABV2SAY2_9GAMM